MPRQTATAAVDDELLTIEEVADRLHCSVSSARRLYRTGDLPAVRLPSRGTERPGPLRFRPSDVRALIARLAEE